MTHRIENTFAKLRGDNRSALIPFIMGYDPDAKTTSALLEALPKAGADLIEIGIPFSDPMADGPVIQMAGRRALDAGASLANILSLVKNFRASNAEVPIILMGYYNPIYRYGSEKFCKDAVAAGVDGVIIVDLPPEEESEISPYLASSSLKLIRLIAPTSDDERIALLSKSATGFVYYISITGITGAKAADETVLKEKISHLRKFTQLPIAIGFGIKTAQQVKSVGQFASAVVVGSSLVDVINKGENKVKAATDYISELAQSLRQASA